jgi:manganese transport protein
VALPTPSASQLQRARSRGRLRGAIAVLGPAFVACIAYVDPGNFATNIAGGAQFGYLLLWVLLVANLMAMLIQNLSAKIGIATGKNLPELCREHFPRPVTAGLWLQAELIAMATDLAEFVGAAIALNLLFGVPMFHAGLITAFVAFAILGLQGRGFRRSTTPCASASTRARPRAGSSRASPAPRASCSPPASSARRSCRTSSTCTPR